MTSIIEATQAHVDDMRCRLAAMNLQECAVVFPEDPTIALQESFDNSTCAFTWLLGETPTAMFGFKENKGSLLGGSSARVWMLGTDDIKAHGKSFARASRKVVRKLIGIYWRIEGIADSRYTTTLRWLSWLGFKFADPVPMGNDGIPFVPFYMERK